MQRTVALCWGGAVRAQCSAVTCSTSSRRPAHIRTCANTADPEAHRVLNLWLLLTLLTALPAPVDPEAHRVLDFWLLLTLLTLGDSQRKPAEALLRRKFAEEHAGPGWLQKSIVGHEVGMGCG